jgi:hypothetical protein
MTALWMEIPNPKIPNSKKIPNPKFQIPKPNHQTIGRKKAQNAQKKHESHE